MINSVSTNNIELRKTQGASTTATTKAPNSIMSENNSTNTEQANSNERITKLENMLQEVAEKYKKYGITVNDLKKISYIQKIYQSKNAESAKVSQEECNKILANLKESLTRALEDSITKDKIDLNKVEELSLKYNIALNTGWNIKDFKETQKSNDKGLFDTLKAHGLLPEDATLENTEPEVIKSKIREACEKVLGTLETHPSPEKIKEQLKQFGALLANSSDIEKQYFNEVLKGLYAENRLHGMKILFDSLKNPNDVTKLADNMNVSEMTVSCSLEQSTAISAGIASRQSETGRAAAHEQVQTDYQEWYEANKEAIDIIDQKIAAAKEQGVEPEFTDAEKQLIAQRNIFTGITSGEMVGTLENQIISTDFKTEHLSTLNQDAYNRNDYREILTQTHSFIEEHKSELTNLPNNYEKLLDDATNGNYLKVASGSNEELSAPVTSKSEDSGETADIGFVSRKPVEQSRIPALKAQLQSTETTPEFRVENVTKPTSMNSAMVEKIQKASSSQDKLAIIKEYFDKSPMLQAALKKFLIIAPDPLRILNTLPTNARASLASQLVRSGKLNEDEIQKLNLSFGAKQLLLNDLEKITKDNENAQV